MRLRRHRRLPGHLDGVQRDQGVGDPPLGGLDLSFLVLILVIQWLLQPMIANSIGRACYVSY